MKIRKLSGGRQSLKFIELFSGAGLFGYSFVKEGFSSVGAYERDRIAVETYRRNVCKIAECGDLSKITPKGKCSIILAGPPCQGFSTIGARDSQDPRNELCLIIPSWAQKTGAEVIVVENVPKFLASVSFSVLCDEMTKLGYSHVSWKINAKDYGVPQNRRRCIVVFSKIGIPNRPATSSRNPTIAEAFAGLPEDEVLEIQHFSRAQSPIAMERIRLIPPEGDIRDLAKANPGLVPPSWFKTNGKIVDIWGRLRWSGTSNTIRTGFLHPSRGRFLHPVANRPITFREAARLQTVPDTFVFLGSPEQLARQIGNGVPIEMGRAIARSIRELFERRSR